MRNIYDIISEQKSLVDINIASYDLVYISEEFDYLQEGVGETIKNAAKKIVEFIKNVIRKIKELISKVLNFFRNKKNQSENSDTDLKAAKNAAVKSGDGSEQHKEVAEEINRRKEEKRKSDSKGQEQRDKEAEDIQKKADEVNKKEDQRRKELEKNQKEYTKNKEEEANKRGEALEKSNLKVKMIPYAGLDKYKNLTDKYFNKLSFYVNKAGNPDSEVNDDMINEFLSVVFSGNGSPNKNPDIELSKRIILELNESDEEREIAVNKLAEIVKSYKDINSIGSYIYTMGQRATDDLDKLRIKFEKIANGGNESANKSVAGVNKLVSMTSSFVNTICTRVVKAHQAYMQVSNKIEGK